MCVDASSWPPLQERRDDKQIKHFRSAHKWNQESSEKVRGMLHAQIQDSTERKYSLEMKKTKITQKY